MIAQVVETAFGMAVIYFLLCVFVGGVNEWVAAWRGTRGKFMKQGVRKLVPDQPIYRRVMQHPLIAAMYRDRVAVGRPPSYLDPSAFAQALIDVVLIRAEKTCGVKAARGEVAGVRASLDAIKDDHPVLAQALVPIIASAGDDYARLMAGVEKWFSLNMDRVAGWFENYTRKRLFWLGLLAAALGNVDSIQLVRGFWDNPALRQEAGAVGDDILAKAATKEAVDAEVAKAKAREAARRLNELQKAGLPIGFACLVPPEAEAEPAADPSPRDVAGVFARCGPAAWETLATGGWLKLLGWLFTALAVSLGAPFWFDALSRIAPLRGVGRKPAPARE